MVIMAGLFPWPPDAPEARSLQLVMLHSSLVAAIAVGALGDARQDSLLGLMPPEAPIVMEIGDLQSLLSQPAEERGDWLKWLSDERTQTLFDLLFEDMKETEVSSMGIMGEMAAEIRGGAMAVMDFEDFAMAGALQVTDEFEEVLIALFENIDEPMMETELLGRRALTDEKGTVAFVESGDLTLMILAEPGEVEATLSSLLASMDEDPREDPWWTGTAGGLDQSIAQLYLHFPSLPLDDDPDLAEVAGIINCMHVDFNVGQGSNGGTSFSIEFQDSEVVDAFAGAFFDDADPSLLLMAPEGAETIQSAKIDVAAIIDATIMYAGAVEPERNAQQEYESVLEAGSTFLGIDIQSELIDNLTGDIIGMQWAVDPEALLGEDIESVLEVMPVLGFGIADPEPFIEFLEIIEPFAAEVGGEVSDEGGITTFRAEVMPGFSLMALVSPNFLYFGGDEARLADAIGREGTVKADGAVDEETYELAKETMTGAGVSIWDIASLAELMSIGFEQDPTMDTPDEFFDVMDAFSEHIQGIGMSDFQFASNTLTIRVMTR